MLKYNYLLLSAFKLDWKIMKLGFRWASRIMKMKITTKVVESLVTQPKVYEVYDENQIGFMVRVLPSGLKSFWIRYRLPTGRRDRFVIGHFGTITVAQAKDKAKSLLAEVVMGKDPKAPKHVQEDKTPTLIEFIKDHYQSWCESHLQCPDKQLGKLYKFTDFLQIPLDGINPRKVEMWRSECLKKGQAPATVNRNLVALRSVLSKAVQWGLLELHPLRRLKQLKVDRSPNVRYLSEDEEKRLRLSLDDREAKLRKERTKGNEWRAVRNYELYPNLDDVPYIDHLKPLVLLSVNTGARQGELFRLQWEDIDFERKNMCLIMRGKRKSHTRHIPLNKEGFQVLEKWRSIRPKTDKLVFPSKNGEKMDNVQTSWENLRKEAKIENFRWHDMRHHFASRLVMKGVPLNTVRELLGHTNLEMTLRYAHLAPEQKVRAVAMLERD